MSDILKLISRSRDISDLSFRINNISRSLLKATSWRVIGTIDTFLLSFVVISFSPQWMSQSENTQSVDVALAAGSIAIAEVLTKIFLYVFHEQIWSRVHWGIFYEAEQATEGKIRSLAKTCTWRITAFLDTTFLVWFFTNDAGIAVSVGVLEVFSKMLLYFFHERIWNKLR